MIPTLLGQGCLPLFNSPFAEPKSDDELTLEWQQLQSTHPALLRAPCSPHATRKRTHNDSVLPNRKFTPEEVRHTGGFAPLKASSTDHSASSVPLELHPPTPSSQPTFRKDGSPHFHFAAKHIPKAAQVPFTRYFNRTGALL
jgi:hypothetical protein